MEFQDFYLELETLTERLPVPASKIKSLTQLAIKYSSKSNEIINIILDFVRKSKSEEKLPLVYVIDSISRNSMKLPDNTYKMAFEAVLPQIFNNLIKCPPNDKVRIFYKDKIKRVVALWYSSEIMSQRVLQGIQQMLEDPRNDLQESSNNAPFQVSDPRTSTTDPRLKSADPRTSYSSMHGTAPRSVSSDPRQVPVDPRSQLEINNPPANNSVRLVPSMMNPQSSEASQNVAPLINPQFLANIAANMNLPSQPILNNQPSNQFQGNNNPGFQMPMGLPNLQMNNLLAMLAATQQPYMQQQSNPQFNALLAQMAVMQGMPMPNQNMPLNNSMQDQNRRTDRKRNRDTFNDMNNPNGRRNNSQLDQQEELEDGPDCVASFKDDSVPADCIKFMSRTLYFSDVSPSLNQKDLRNLVSPFGRIETLNLSNGKMQAFLKIATRAEAEAIRQNLTGHQTGHHRLKIGWGCGYGPRQHFDYAGGFTMFPLSEIPESDKSFIENSPPRGGGPIIGGTVCEEPNVPIQVALQSRGRAPKHGNSARANPY